MLEIVSKYKKGTQIQIGENRAIIVSDLIKFKEFLAIYADIIQNTDFKQPCGTCKIHDNVALIIRDKEKLSEIGLTTEERKAIYCHELGHCFSSNQQKSKNSERNIDDEVDSDTFAVEKCDISPYVLEKALAKSYEYEIQNIGKKVGLTQEALNRYVEEMRTRKRNVQRLIHIFEEKESSIE